MMNKKNKILNKTLCRVMPAALALAFASCGGDSFSEPEAADEGMCVSITLADQGSADTRAGGADSEDINGEYGTVNDNYINIDDLYILTFSIPEEKDVLDDNSKLLEILWSPDQNERKESSAVYSNGEQILLRTELSSSIAEYKGNFCIVALANISSFPHQSSDELIFKPVEKMTFKQLRSSSLFEYKMSETSREWNWKPFVDVVNNNKHGIPMFGVKRVSLAKYDKKLYNEANPFPLMANGNSTVWLLRAFAKVSIELSDDLKNLKIDGQALDMKIISANLGNRYGGNFYMIPDLSRMENFGTTGGTGQIFKEPDFSNEEGLLLNPASNENILHFNIEEDGKSAYVYLPEYRLTDDLRPKISFIMKGNDNKEYDLKFELKKYSNESAGNEVYWNYILRNYTYRFQVTVDFRIVTVNPTDWGDAYDNEYIFGNTSTEDNNNDNGDDSGSENET